MTTPDARETILRVLSEHRYQGSYLNAWCSCENVDPIPRDPETGRRPEVNVAAMHRAHLAQVLLAAIPTPAQAWDEGYQAACDETPMDATPDGPDDRRNPYRAALGGRDA